jgi:hypothetical protein
MKQTATKENKNTQMGADGDGLPSNVTTLPIETMRVYPMATGMSEGDIRARIEKVYWIKEKLMKNGVHYGVTPHQVSEKPCLYQPGAQLLNVIFQHAPSYQREVQRLEDDIFLFNIDCTLTHYPTGMVVGAGMGGANTGESRYKDKNPLQVYNTVLKIGAKRSYVAATVSCVGVSEIFTQDLEDDLLPEGAGGAPQQPRQKMPEPARRKHTNIEGVLEKVETIKSASGTIEYWGAIKAQYLWTKLQELGERMLELDGESVIASGVRSATKANTFQLLGIERVTKKGGRRG